MFLNQIGFLRVSAVALGTFGVVLVSACEPGGQGGPYPDDVAVHLPGEGAIEEALESVTEEELREYTQVLASDEFGGRAP